ncbi:MAG: NlpC/P60 family protein [Bdellovibrionia bacterium]
MIFALYPVGTSLNKIITVALALMILAQSMYVLGRKARMILAVAIFVPAATVMFWPALPSGTPGLRETYLGELAGFEGTMYVWGGENSVGIDCSGLIRKSMVNALIKEGLKELRFDLTRKAAEIWFFDATAKALSEGFRGFTERKFDVDSVNETDSTKLRPGDFMVTKNGVHTMAYLGDSKWIEADPEQGRVIEVKTPSTIGWFRTPAVILTWAVP